MTGTGRLFDPVAATVTMCLLSTLATLLVFLATGTSAAIGPLIAISPLVLIPASIHVVYTRLRPAPLIAAVSGGVASLVWAGLSNGMTALAALRTQAPLVDDALARADALLGVSAPALTVWVAARPWFSSALNIAYLSTVPAVFAAVLFLGATGRTSAMWRLCFIFAGAGLTCTLPNTAVPAIGAFVHYALSPTVSALLPPGAGRYFLPAFEAYHSGMRNVVDVRCLDGVVEFPSFHTAMALMVAHALYRVPLVSAISWGWCGLVLVSTIPIGGHYVVDSLGGLVVWASFAALSRLSAHQVDLEHSFMWLFQEGLNGTLVRVRCCDDVAEHPGALIDRQPNHGGAATVQKPAQFRDADCDCVAGRVVRRD